jgi:uncharacterized protein (TIGR02118 family)
MYKLVALWSAPKVADMDAFEKAYLEVHCPKARALPNLAGLETIRIKDGLEGGTPGFHRVAVMIWPDRAAFERDEHTAEWRALREDAGEMIGRFGVTLNSAMGNDG